MAAGEEMYSAVGFRAGSILSVEIGVSSSMPNIDGCAIYQLSCHSRDEREASDPADMCANLATSLLRGRVDYIS